MPESTYREVEELKLRTEKSDSQSSELLHDGHANAPGAGPNANANSTTAQITQTIQERAWKRIIRGDLLLALVLTIGMSVIYFMRLGPFAPPPIDFHPYIKNLQEEIKSHWKPTSKIDSNVAVHFKVHKNGELTDVGFDRMSRISSEDAAALKSIVESMPALPPLPAGAPESVDVKFHFESHAQKRASIKQ